MLNLLIHMVKQIKIGLVIKVFFVYVIASSLVSIYYVYYAMPGFQRMYVQDVREKSREGVEVALGLLNSYHSLEEEGILTTAEAQARALAEIGDLRYTIQKGEGTFWVTDYQPVLLSDPTAPSLVNTNVGHITDENGDSVFRNMVNICGNEGGGFYDFKSDYAGDGGGEKLSYIGAFEPWGWVVGTGVYRSDVMATWMPINYKIGIFFGAIGFFAEFLFWLAIRNMIGKPLSSLAKTSEALAMGDIEQKITIKSSDEIGTLAASQSKVIDYMKETASLVGQVADGDLTVEVKPRSEKDAFGNAFSHLISRQRDLIGKVKTVAGNVSEASRQLTKAAEQTAQATQQIASTIQQVAKGAAEQSSALQKTASSVDELSGSISQIAQGSQEQANGVYEATETVKKVSMAITEVSGNAQAGAKDWENTADSAREGARKTHETVEGMDKVKKAMSVVSLKVADLGERSGEIGKIVATIDDIAAQTNLLALNAAIEAARAGDQGRGFAVVADEVRKLAERSSLATKEIASIVGGIQNGVREAVNAMQQGSQEVEIGYKLAMDAGGALDDILGRSQSVGVQVEQISAAAQELQSLSGSMVQAIERINRIVEQNAVATQQMTASSSVVSRSVETTASVAEENSASSEEVSASVEEMSAQVEETLAAAQSLADMSEEMARSVEIFRVRKEPDDSGNRKK